MKTAASASKSFLCTPRSIRGPIRRTRRRRLGRGPSSTTPDTVLVEVDEDTTAYDKGHIRGAVKLDWKQDLQDPVRRDFIGKQAFEQLLSSRGIGNDDTIVLYGGNNNWFAAYAYWYFKLYGHQNVKLLDGGRKYGARLPRARGQRRRARSDDLYRQ